MAFPRCQKDMPLELGDNRENDAQGEYKVGYAEAPSSNVRLEQDKEKGSPKPGNKSCGAFAPICGRCPLRPIGQVLLYTDPCSVHGA